MTDKDDEFNTTLELRHKFNSYNGTININVLELLAELDNETKRQIISDGGWFSFITEAMAKAIINEFSREHYNPIYTKLRSIILNSEAMPAMIREWATTMVAERERAKRKEFYWDNAYGDLRSWVRNNVPEEYRDGMPSLPKSDTDISYKDIQSLVDNELRGIGELFPPKEDDND